MPLYDFHCPHCDHEFEAHSEAGAEATCPECGAIDAERLWRPIASPSRIGLRGYAAQRSNDARRAREEHKRGAR
jgi:putative FmdB family regulatory protein